MGERTRELLLLITGDLIVFFTSLYLTLLVRYLELPTQATVAVHFWPFFILSCLWLFVFYIGGLYDKHTVVLKSLLVGRIINIQIVNIILAACLFFLIPFGITPKTNLAIYLAISILLITMWRLSVFPRLTSKTDRRAILIADGPEAIELVDEINNNDRYSYTFVRLIDGEVASKTPDFGAKLLALIERERIGIIVADPQNRYLEQVLPSLFDQAFINHQFTFLDFYNVYEETFDRIPLSSLRYEWFLTHVSHTKNLGYSVAKRAIDIVLSLVLGAFLLLILPFIYLAMRLEGKGPIFITQDRIGQYGAPIKIYKLRTMTQNFSGSGTWTTEDAKLGNVVTKTGAVLRKLSVDELPQVWTILKGEMSLIGPRNDTAGLGERLAEVIPHYKIRYFVKPGVTGWAQTNQRYMSDNISPQSIDESKVRLAYDLYYVKNRSLTLDVAIALKTITTVLSRFGVTIRFFR